LKQTETGDQLLEVDNTEHEKRGMVHTKLAFGLPGTVSFPSALLALTHAPAFGGNLEADIVSSQLVTTETVRLFDIGSPFGILFLRDDLEVIWVYTQLDST
jgi:hypothetical protein